MAGLRSRLTYANVTATLALFLALAGGTTAIALSGKNTVASDDIIKGQVKSSDIGGSQVANGDLAKDSVSGGKVKPETLFGADIGAAAVGTSEIGDRAVGAADLATVPAARIAGGGTLVDDNTVEEVFFADETTTGTYDPMNMWSPANPKFIVVPIDGMYAATGRVRWANDDTETPGGFLDQGWRMLQITGPNNQDWREVIGANRHGVETMSQVGTVLLNLRAGESVSMQVGQSNEDGTDGLAALETWLAVSWIGPSPGPVNLP